MDRVDRRDFLARSAALAGASLSLLSTSAELAYLRQWAVGIGVDDLLEEMLDERH